MMTVMMTMLVICSAEKYFLLQWHTFNANKSEEKYAKKGNT